MGRDVFQFSRAEFESSYAYDLERLCYFPKWSPALGISQRFDSARLHHHLHFLCCLIVCELLGFSRPLQVEDCIDLTLEPRPVGYGATRRMARRFDETLIVEVEMVGAKEGNGRIF